MRKEKFNDYDKFVSDRCKHCNGKLYVKIFKNKVDKKQIGLYCSRCNKYIRFLTENDVFYYVGVGCRIVNEYGPLYKSKLNKLKGITNLNYQRHN